MKTGVTVPEDDFLVLSSLPPTRAQKQLALVFVLGLLVVVFIIAGPLSDVRLPRVDAFVPAHVMAMFVNDSITAVLLFAQFSILRSRAILVLASGYLFTALVLIPYVLVFPGLFVPGRGLFGGMQTYIMALVFLARCFSHVRNRLCLVKGCGAKQTILAGHGERGDHPECRLDGSHHLDSGISLHSGRSKTATRDAQFPTS